VTERPDCGAHWAWRTGVHNEGRIHERDARHSGQWAVESYDRVMSRGHCFWDEVGCSIHGPAMAPVVQTGSRGQIVLGPWYSRGPDSVHFSQRISGV
jgi:hypothetical protein